MKRKKQNAPKLPAVVTVLGDAVEIRARLNDGTDRLYRFGSGNRRRAFLCSNPSGRRLYVLPVKPVPASRLKKRPITNEIKRAARMYEKWSDFEADRGSLIDVPKKRLNKVGRVTHVVYRSDKWDGRANDYIHSFDAPPILWADRKAKPDVLALTGGKIRVTQRGIVG